MNSEVKEFLSKIGKRGGKMRLKKVSAERRAEIARQGGIAKNLKYQNKQNSKRKGAA